MRRVPSYLVPVAGGAAGLGLAYWYLSRPGRSLASGAADLEALLTGSVGLSDAQRAIVHLIEEEATAAGLGFLGPALVANAYAESRLDPLAAGDAGHSVGLFQLYDKGLGAGMSVEDRQNPRLNTRAVLAEAKRKGLDEVKGRTNRQLASEFARLVEVCSTCGVGQEQYVTRGDNVAKLFGDAVAAAVPRG